MRGILVQLLLVTPFFLLMGCSRPNNQQSQLPGNPRDSEPISGHPVLLERPSSRPDQGQNIGPYALDVLPDCEMTAAANLDGAGDSEIICWNQNQLSIWSPEHHLVWRLNLVAADRRIGGVPNVMKAAPLVALQRQQLLIGFGMARGALDVPVTLVSLAAAGVGKEIQPTLIPLYSMASSRAQVVAIQSGHFSGAPDSEILLAHYDSKYHVSAHLLPLPQDITPDMQPAVPQLLTRIRMASGWATGDLNGDGRPEIIVGRPYGEENLSPGDIFLHNEGKRDMIPSRLGIRSVVIGDGDHDGHNDVLFGDGWHYEYGQKAKGRLSIARKLGSEWKTELIQQTEGQIEIRKIELVDIDSDAKAEIVAAGDRYTNLYWKAKDSWMVSKLNDQNDFTLARQGGVPVLVISGQPISMVSLTDKKVGGKAVPPPPPDQLPGIPAAGESAKKPK